MVVKMRKWTPWHVAATTTAKFEVAVKPVKLELVPRQQEHVTGDDADDGDGKWVAIRIKWKGEPKFFPVISRPKRYISAAKRLKKKFRIIQWDDGDGGEDAAAFKNTCSFTSSSPTLHDQKFAPWEVAFDILIYEKKIDRRPTKKASVVGKAALDIGEIACKARNSSVQQTIPLTSQIDGVSTEATLTVLLTFAEIGQIQDPMLINNSNNKGVSSKLSKPKGRRRRSLSQEEMTEEEEEESSFEALTKSKSIADVSVASDKKQGWFSWTSKRFISFKRAKTSDESPVSPSTEDSFNDRVSQKEEGLGGPCLVPEQEDEACPLGSWEEKEITSRDHQTKLKASVFFASFDQCSDEAAGEGACTTLVTVISHWLHSNEHELMPNRSEFDSLIVQGSSEWRSLCQDSARASHFPNKHFDLETVLGARIRPVEISHEKSFVGFFGAEKFESLKGAMSFDEMWDGIVRNAEDDGTKQRMIYIVSWNDHFFVVKVEASAYYIIDTLGERLHEGCNRASEGARGGKGEEGSLLLLPPQQVADRVQLHVPVLLSSVFVFFYVVALLFSFRTH